VLTSFVPRQLETVSESLAIRRRPAGKFDTTDFIEGGADEERFRSELSKRRN
jgi:hypothetical protein